MFKKIILLILLISLKLTKLSHYNMVSGNLEHSSQRETLFF